MSFTTLRPITANEARTMVPPYGVRINVTGRAQEGLRSTAGYTAIGIGRHLATTLRMTRTECPVVLMAGEDDDAGKLIIQPDENGRFIAKKQVGGGYQLSLGYHTTREVFAQFFNAFTIDTIQVAGGQALITIPQAARAIGAAA